VMDALKADPRTARIPIVIVSAKTLEPHERRRLDAYAESVWQKGSFSAKDLVVHVADLVEDGQRHEEVNTGSTPPKTNKSAMTSDFGTMRRERILLIDGYEPEARLIRRLLETRPNFEVLEARSGEEALAMLEEVKPDLVIMDLLLPDISGEKLLDSLRVHPNACKVPVVIVTSQDTGHDSGQAGATRTRLASNVESIWSKAVLDRSSFLSHIETVLVT
jgi:CheY-like chemotaxis protein